MERKSKQYLEKRRKIIRIIETIEVTYETKDCYHKINPSWHECIKQAELILQKLGVNKPEFLRLNETETSILG